MNLRVVWFYLWKGPLVAALFPTYLVGMLLGLVWEALRGGLDDARGVVETPRPE